LIELILVMALLVVIAAIVTPQMSQFFRGRTLENVDALRPESRGVRRHPDAGLD
jgi:Tfp pilus assembly protein PilE